MGSPDPVLAQDGIGCCSASTLDHRTGTVIGIAGFQWIDGIETPLEHDAVFRWQVRIYDYEWRLEWSSELVLVHVVGMSQAIKCFSTLVAMSSVVACDARETMTSQSTHVSALVSQGKSTTVVFAETEHQSEAHGVLVGRRPSGFPWVAIELVGQSASQAFSPKGVVLDLRDPGAGVSFSQSYQGMCNPAKEDRSSCWLFERYTSGDANLSGTIELKIADGSATSLYEVMWEGPTDRFGDPVQWHRHGTTGGAAGALQVTQ